MLHTCCELHSAYYTYTYQVCKSGGSVAGAECTDCTDCTVYTAVQVCAAHCVQWDSLDSDSGQSTVTLPESTHKHLNILHLTLAAC